MQFSPQPFEIDWREEDTRRWLAAQSNPIRPRGPDHDQTSSALDRWLARAVGGHVAWLLCQPTPVLSQGLEGLDTGLTRALKELEANPRSTPFQTLVGGYFLEAIKQHLGGDTDGHRALVGFVMTGDFPDLGVKESCQATGAEVGYGFKQWACAPIPKPGQRMSMGR